MHPIATFDGAEELLRQGHLAEVSAVRLTLRNEPFRLPPDLAFLRARWDAAHPGERSGPRLSVERIEWTDGGGLHVTARPSEWAEARAWQDAIPARRHELARRQRVDPSGAVDCGLPTLLSLHVVVRTLDDHVVASRRSPTVHFYPSCWSLSLEEGVEEWDLGAGADFVEACALRGVREEMATLSHALEGATVRSLGAVFERDLLMPALVAEVRLPIVAAEVPPFEANEEVTVVELLPTKPPDLAAWQRGGTRPWHPTSRYRLFRCLTPGRSDEEAWALAGRLTA